MPGDYGESETKLHKILKRGHGSAARFVLALREADRPMRLAEIADLLGVSVASLRAQTVNQLFELGAIESIPDSETEDRRRKLYRLRDLSVVDGRTPSEKLRDKKSRTRRTDL